MPDHPGSFVPSSHAFGFTNAWPSAPAILRQTPLGTIALGNASAGLCGGMVFAALDYWHAGRAAPTARPTPGDALYEYLGDRLVDSWHLPAGALQYYQWMLLPDGDLGFDVFGRHVVTERGVAWRTIREQWRSIRTDLDRGVPVPLGLVTVHAADVTKVGLNHQVLAVGYESSAAAVTLRVYDPNHGRKDGATISFDPRRPTRPTAFTHTIGIARPIRGFFRTAYAPKDPPPG